MLWNTWNATVIFKSSPSSNCLLWSGAYLNTSIYWKIQGLRFSYWNLSANILQTHYMERRCSGDWDRLIRLQGSGTSDVELHLHIFFFLLTWGGYVQYGQFQARKWWHRHGRAITGVGKAILGKTIFLLFIWHRFLWLWYMVIYVPRATWMHLGWLLTSPDYLFCSNRNYPVIVLHKYDLGIHNTSNPAAAKGYGMDCDESGYI